MDVKTVLLNGIIEEECLICEPIDLQENESNCEVDYAVECQEQCTLSKTNLIIIDQ